MVALVSVNRSESADFKDRYVWWPQKGNRKMRLKLEQALTLFPQGKDAFITVIGLYRTRPVHKSGKFSKPISSGSQTFSFPNAGLLTLFSGGFGST